MTLFQVSLLFHLIGTGILFASLVGGWIVHNAYLRAETLQAQGQLLKVLKPIGLLGPVGILIMLVTAFGNLAGLGFEFSAETVTMQWVMDKTILFVLASANGIIFGIRSAKRGKLVMSMIQGNAPADAQLQKEKYDKGAKVFFYVQAVLFFALLLRAVVK